LCAQAAQDALAPTRVSRRKRGEAAEPEDDDAGEGAASRAAAKASAAHEEPAPAAAPGRGRVVFPEPRDDLRVCAPFTLLSIGCVAAL
jgi:hypothetical protein